MAVPGSLAQRIFLLAYDPGKGRVPRSTNLGAMLRAAALTDLYLKGYLTDDGGRAVTDGPHPCRDYLLEALLEEIAAVKPRKWQFWVERRQRFTVSAVRRQLSEDGWVRLEPHKILGLFPTVQVTVRDPRVRKQLLGRVSDALKNPVGRVDPADAALVAIAAAGDLNRVVDRRTRRAHKRRIQELTEMAGPVGPALRKSIRDAVLAAVG